MHSEQRWKMLNLKAKSIPVSEACFVEHDKNLPCHGNSLCVKVPRANLSKLLDMILGIYKKVFTHLIHCEADS